VVSGQSTADVLARAGPCTSLYTVYSSPWLDTPLHVPHLVIAQALTSSGVNRVFGDLHGQKRDSASPSPRKSSRVSNAVPQNLRLCNVVWGEMLCSEVTNA